MDPFVFVIQNGPELLPREDMMRLCLYIIGTSAGRVQQMAAQALLDTVEAASGCEGCAVATQGEVDVLLQALQSSASPVREAGLKVGTAVSLC